MRCAEAFLSRCTAFAKGSPDGCCVLQKRTQICLNGGSQMIAFLIGFAFVAMVLFPAVLATIHRSRSINSDD